MRVAAKPGLKVPMEGKPRMYITEATDIPDTTYYRRLIADGSLVEAAAEAPAAKAKPAKGAETDEQ
jgi:hypothetical protein